MPSAYTQLVDSHAMHRLTAGVDEIGNIHSVRQSRSILQGRHPSPMKEALGCNTEWLLTYAPLALVSLPFDLLR